MRDHRRCIQCGDSDRTGDLIVNRTDRKGSMCIRVCLDAQACRDRWFARLAYELEVG